MVKLHLKRINAPRTWKIKRQTNTFIMRPAGSGHKLEHGMPLSVILKEFLGVAKTSKEVKDIVYNKEVLIDGVRRKDLAYHVGLFDVLEIPEIKKSYRIMFDTRGKLICHEIEAKEKDSKPLKIIAKTMLKKGKIQLNFNDGKNKLVEKDNYKVGDSIVMSLKEQKMIHHYPLEKGAQVYFIGGKYVGQIGTVQSIDQEFVKFKTENNADAETVKRYAFVVGKEASCISMPKNKD